jgi:O-antigen/teichoic acid export membrane protein
MRCSVIRESHEVDILHTRQAGPRAIRGGLVRSGAYLAGTLLGALSAVLLLRHLGVVDFGRYTTVMALVAIVGGVTDAGLTIVGSRELAVRRRGPDRERLTANIVAIRLVLTPLGVLAAVAFAAIAGYQSELVVGTAIAGAGLVLVNMQASMMLPLSVELRNAALAGAEILRQLVTTVGIAVLVVVGAALLPFFGVQVLVGVVVLALTPLLLRRPGLISPRFDRADWRMLAREALPLAAAFVLGILYFRILMIMMSLISSDTETGLFATSFRFIEILVGIPLLLVGVVLPIASVAAESDAERLRYVLQRVGEVALLVSLGLAVCVAIAAEPVIVLLGGDEYRAAAPVLRIQVFALVGIFVAQGWTIGLLAMREQRLVAVANLAGLLAITILGFVLIPISDARGAAAAAVAADLLLALTTLFLLRRAGPGRTIRFGYVPRVLLAGGLAALVALVPGVPAVGLALLAGAVFLGAAKLLGAVPQEAIEALPVIGGRPKPS